MLNSDRQSRARGVGLRCLWILCMSGNPLIAQGMWGLVGMITVDGDAVANVTVTATNTETRFTRNAITSQDGRYSIPSLPPGTYTVKAVLGAWAASLDNVILWGGENVTVNLDILPGPVASPPVYAGGEAQPSRIIGREFLLRNESEKNGYGLYSYLLFGSPPNYATRDRFIKTMEAYLRFSEAKDLGRLVPLAQLNITYVPLFWKPKSVTPELLVDQNYDYSRAQVLLAKLPREPHAQGPYIVSTLIPLSAQTVAYNHYLFQDLSSVPPEVISLWVQEFVEQSAQREFWRERNGHQAALKLRTAIARVAEGIDPAKRSLDQWQSILSTLLFWKERATVGGAENP